MYTRSFAQIAVRVAIIALFLIQDAAAHPTSSGSRNSISGKTSNAIASKPGAKTGPVRQTIVKNSPVENEKPKQTKPGKQEAATNTQKSKISYYYKKLIKHLWGTGSLKQNFLRRTATAITLALAGIKAISALTTHGARQTPEALREPADEKPKARSMLEILAERERKNEQLLQTVRDKNSFDGDAEPINQFVYAALTGNIKRVGELLQQCPDIDAFSTSSYTLIHDFNALQAASSSGKTDIVRLLLSQRADPNLLSRDKTPGMSPLHLASAEKRYGSVQALLEAEGDPNIRNGWQQTPLMCASGDVNILAALLAAKADIGATDMFKSTALHAAARECAQDAVQLLLDQSKNGIDDRDTFGRTPLYCAVSASDGPSGNNTQRSRTLLEDKIETVRTLLENNADPAIPDNQNKTPLDSANDEIQRLLRQCESNSRP